MPNVQFCPVCGYALKRSERQCGRCGEELIAGSRDSGDTVTEKDGGTRWGSDYTIEAISFGGKTTSGYGIRDLSDSNVSDKKVERSYEDALESQKIIEELRKQVEEANKRVINMKNEAARLSLASRRPAGEKPPEENERKRNIRRLRKRTDPEFRALVDKHLGRIREIQATDTGVSHNTQLKHLAFISEKVMSPGLPEESVVLFVGPPGTMKSILAADQLLKIAREQERNVLYIVLGESAKALESKLLLMGIMKAEDRARIRIVDRREIKKNTAEMQGTWRKLLMRYIEEQRRLFNYSLLVLDSLNALASMVSNEKARKATFEFFEWCRNSGLTAIAVKEGSYDISVSEKSAEAYLADGVVQFTRAGDSAHGTMPIFRLMKMRGARIDSGYYAFQFVSGTLKIVSAVGL